MPAAPLRHLSPDSRGAELAGRCGQIVDGAAGGAWVLDGEARTTLANGHLATLLGTTVDAMRGHPLTDYMSAAQRKRAQTCLASWQRGVAGQQDVEFERCDGQPIWLSLATVPILDAHGGCLGTLALASDITAGRQAQADLARARQLSQATLDALTAHVSVVDSTGSILAVNQAWTAFAADNGGSPEATGVGANYLCACARACGPHCEEAEAFAIGLRDVLEGRRATFELQYACHSDTEERWFLVSVSHLEGCEPARAVIAHQPVTTRVLAEAQLRETQKLESLGTLAGGIAHDFNNILAAVLGNASLAIDDLRDLPRARARVEQILLAGTRARELTQRILAFSRRQPHAFVPLMLRPLVEETMALLRDTLPAHVDIVTRFQAEPIKVLADASQLQQVLMNLGTNAWHALQGRPGRITVTLGREDATQAKAAAAGGQDGPGAGNWAEIIVADDGVGMDEHLRARIFEPFFTTRPLGQGTGLGLSIVHGIVAEHGGAVTVETNPGHGSAFHVYLPALDPSPAAMPADGGAASAAAVSVANCRVVCVDDDPVVGTVVQALLERAGCAVRYFADPVRALDAICAQPEAVDLVVTDHSMPGMSGVQLAAELVRLRPQLPVILVSGYIADATVDGAGAAGVREVLRKEAAFEELPAAVARVVAARNAPC